MKFQDPMTNAFGDMLWTSLVFPFLQKQWTITPKLPTERFQPLVTELLHIEVYKDMKFHDPTMKEFQDVPRKSLFSPLLQKQKGNNSKTTNGKVSALSH